MSSDGYVRTSLATLSALPFIHFASDSDLEFLTELKMQTVPALAAGFSEWISTTAPVVSLGWGWFIHSASKRLLLAPDIVRSNVMLVDARGYDLGQKLTSSLCWSWLTAYNWQEAVADAMHFPPSTCQG